MRLILFLLSLYLFTVTYAQDNDEVQVKNTIDTFFEGFHRKDSLAVRKTVTESVQLQTIGVDKEGQERLATVPFDNFLRPSLRSRILFNFRRY